MPARQQSKIRKLVHPRPQRPRADMDWSIRRIPKRLVAQPVWRTVAYHNLRLLWDTRINIDLFFFRHVERPAIPERVRPRRPPKRDAVYLDRLILQVRPRQGAQNLRAEV